MFEMDRNGLVVVYRTAKSVILYNLQKKLMVCMYSYIWICLYVCVCMQSNQNGQKRGYKHKDSNLESDIMKFFSTFLLWSNFNSFSEIFLTVTIKKSRLKQKQLQLVYWWINFHKIK